MNVERIGGELTYRHSRTSSVTTSWGVDWDEEFIARDLLQNFYDATPTAPVTTALAPQRRSLRRLIAFCAITSTQVHKVKDGAQEK